MALLKILKVIIVILTGGYYDGEITYPEISSKDEDGCLPEEGKCEHEYTIIHRYLNIDVAQYFWNMPVPKITEGGWPYVGHETQNEYRLNFNFNHLELDRPLIFKREYTSYPLENKVCLKCGTCVNELEEYIEYKQNEIDRENKRDEDELAKEELALKIWNECKGD